MLRASPQKQMFGAVPRAQLALAPGASDGFRAALLVAAARSR